MIRGLFLLTVAFAFALLAATPAPASTLDRITFTVSVTSGQWTGETYTGAFSWDPSVQGKLNSFSATFPIWTNPPKSDSSLPEVIFVPGSGLPYPGYELYFDPPAASEPNSFVLRGIGQSSGTFIYGSVSTGGAFEPSGVGAVSFGPMTTSSTPEPGTLLLLTTGLAGAFASVRHKLSAQATCKKP
jgi:hypothetical protein